MLGDPEMLHVPGMLHVLDIWGALRMLHTPGMLQTWMFRVPQEHTGDPLSPRLSPPLILSPPPGYSVSSLQLPGGQRLFVAGAPRFQHKGKVVLFQLDPTGTVMVTQALMGEQVRAGRGP